MNHIPRCRTLAIPVAFYFPWGQKTKKQQKVKRKLMQIWQNCKIYT